MLEIKSLEILYLSRHGHDIAYGLTEEDLFAVAPSLRHAKDKLIVAKPARVGIVVGIVYD
ncbi:hypothetical protein ETAA8_03230 [Anatilimnocola aggregata]|uniref:Uncharacterized protein n=1 Tax=Anatilimnocola aggregata TaxID=2528021 RepID=A0A517Y4T2_9BACT|nr:hypothetical protein [Anatilimnocola aggregata]QDU25259.1 hypothetical protein ETAA8_03230 [Anatilimnocola aggregata]